MSTLSHSLLLTPPSTIFSMQETIIGQSLPCNYCKGSGHIWTEDHDGSALQTPCPCCKGSGSLSPYITIQWSPTPPH